VTPRVAVVVPTREPAASPLLGDALRALGRQTISSSLEAIVVGDGVPAPRIEGARALEVSPRGGFATAANAGIEAALAGGAAFVFLLNDDTLLEPDCVERLLAAAARRRDHALFSPRILYPGTPERIWWAGGSYSPRLGVPHHLGRGRRRAASSRRERTITFATGCALLVRREVFEKAGLLSTDFFAYGEDVDFSLRALRAGFRILFVPDAALVHRVEESGRRREGEPWRLRLATANLLRLLRLHASPLDRVTALPWFLLRWMACLSLRSLLRGDGESIAALYRGLLDYHRSPERAAPPADG